MYKFELNDPSFLPHIACEVQFNLAPGQALVITGDNGIGKTTLLQHFIRQFPALPIGIIEQKPLDFFYDYTLTQVRKIQPGIDKFWPHFKLSEKGKRRFSMLSGGEAQALKISCALASLKPCYVMDEPSQALDEEKKKVLSKLVSDFLHEGKSLLIVEHDLAWLPDRIPVIKLGLADGKIKVVDSWTT